MDKDKHLETHLRHCARNHKRLLREGLWLWEDSPNTEDLLESDDIPDVL
ncbi:MAG: hypothetical protein MJK06_14860 [Hyphomicrobiales bacterium]|nr:hypothetical protein [Hyphomicrobiales bacterium]